VADDAGGAPMGAWVAEPEFLNDTAEAREARGMKI